MQAHLKYLGYVLRHKWYVFLAGIRTGAPIWRLIIHDFSKFRPSEWGPYVDFFYRDNETDEDPRGEDRHYDPSSGSLAFNVAWMKHQHRNPHHWQHWVLREDDGGTKPLPMPDPLVREMVADWMGASRAQGHGYDVRDWYSTNRKKMVLHPSTERRVKQLVFDKALVA